jgi:heme exporter protein D
MAFSSISDFIHMGGHGFYVWLAYSAGAIVLIYNYVVPRMHKLVVLKKISQQIKREKLSK